jgi:hypothetical protein
MVGQRKIYQRLKGIRISLKIEVSRLEDEIKRHNKDVDDDRVKSLAEMKTKLRKEFDSVSKKNGPYKRS